jgi:hypothetical protein
MVTTSTKRFIIHSILLLIISGATFAWVKSPLATYTLQLTGLLVIAYVLNGYLARKKVALALRHKVTLDLILMSAVTFLLILSTGSLYSPLFFLVYFLLFGVALLFEPLSAVSLALFASGFLLLGNQKEILAELLQLGSMFLITPLAVIFGKQYLKLSADESKIKVLETQGIALENEVARQEDEVKSWTTQELSKRLIFIQSRIKNILADQNITQAEKQNLKEIFTQIYQVFVSGQKMQEKVEE